MIIIKKQGGSPEILEKSILCMKKMFGDNLNQFGIVVVDNQQGVLYEKGKYAYNEILILLKELLINEDHIVVVTFSDNYAYRTPIYDIYSPILLSDTGTSLEVIEEGVCDYFMATSLAMRKKQLALPLHKLLHEHRSSIIDNDFEEVFKSYKSVLKNEKFVIGSKSRVYIHNEADFFEHEGILYSNQALGKYVMRKLDTNLSLIHPKKTVLGKYFIYKSLYELFKDDIYFQQTALLEKGKPAAKYVIKGIDSKTYLFYFMNTKTNIVEAFRFQCILDYYTPFWKE